MTLTKKGQVCPTSGSLIGVLKFLSLAQGLCPYSPDPFPLLELRVGSGHKTTRYRFHSLVNSELLCTFSLKRTKVADFVAKMVIRHSLLALTTPMLGFFLLGGGGQKERNSQYFIMSIILTEENRPGYDEVVTYMYKIWGVDNRRQ